MNTEPLKLLSRWAEELGNKMREDREKIIDEICDQWDAEHPDDIVPKEEREGLKQVAPITMICSGRVYRYGNG